MQDSTTWRSRNDVYCNHGWNTTTLRVICTARDVTLRHVYAVAHEAVP